MTNPVLLSLRTDQTDRLRLAWTLAEARAYEARLAANLVVLALGVAAARRKPAGAARPSAARQRTRPMTNPVLLSLRTDQTDRLRLAWTLAEARAYEARADACLAAAAYYAAVGARDQAGEATEEAARYQQAAHATLDIAREGGPDGEAA